LRAREARHQQERSRHERPTPHRLSFRISRLGAASWPPTRRRTEIKLDPAALFLDEVFTDRRVGTIRRLTPVDGNGAPDPARKIVYIGETQVMSNVGALPIVFEIDATSLADAATKFGPLAKDAVEQTMRELQDLRRQALVDRRRRAGCRPAAPGGGGKIQLP
jgi:hypothetical protein